MQLSCRPVSNEINDGPLAKPTEPSGIKPTTYLLHAAPHHH
jgi:hypothetical protein